MGYPDTPSALAAVEAITAPVSVTHWYTQWAGWTCSGIPGCFNPSGYNFTDAEPQLRAELARGRLPMITWEAWGTPGANPTGHDDFPVEQIAAGAYDSYIDSWARGAATIPGTFLMRPLHEMNYARSVYPWSCWDGHSPATYVAAWRHIVDRFRLAGATNVKWVFNPGTDLVPNPMPAACYPGDAYVDYVGWDAYGGGNGHVPTDLAWLQTNLPGTGFANGTKPWLLGEVSGNAAWVTNELAPAVRARGMTAVWFEEGSFSIASQGAGAAIRAMLAP